MPCTNAVNRMGDMVADRDRLLEAKNAMLDEKDRLLADKTVLARELQHRVRNNLQLVYRMLEQAGPDHLGWGRKRWHQRDCAPGHGFGTGL